MATIDDLLDGPPVTEDINEAYYINPITREIEIPADECILGTNEDDKSECKFFRIPKVIGNDIHVMDCDVRIYYQTAAVNVQDCYVVKELIEQADCVVFYWEISSRVVCVPGEVEFSVGITKSVDGVIEKAWNTVCATAIVLQTSANYLMPEPPGSKLDVIARVESIAATADASKDAAQQSATEASGYSSTAAAEANKAASAAAAASSSATRAEAATSSAEAAASAAARSASAAADVAAGIADVSADAKRAAESATAAERAAATASSEAGKAKSSADSAATGATEASNAANTATSKASEASTAASTANSNAVVAISKASEAATSANDAANSASSAQTAANAAAASANAAANSASAAQAAANAAAEEAGKCVAKAGDTMTGNLSIPEPTEDAHAATKGYVDSIVAGTKVPVTLTAAGWTGSGPYKQSVAVAGLASSMRVIVYPAYGDDDAANISMKEACACVSYAKSNSGNIIFTCLEDKPSVDITAIVEVHV